MTTCFYSNIRIVHPILPCKCKKKMSLYLDRKILDKSFNIERSSNMLKNKSRFHSNSHANICIMPMKKISTVLEALSVLGKHLMS
ncbi:hypothetical protein OIU77_024044 [Salix suchowensis]|uniref:Uncharacterized protein n=1 Tax=Salix suchowensis TaxID=1278906 RepID=A0ABQ9C5Y5_9ROSI|nr:hypothetical protein OIU77_024044 [Salix suchowensis]